jgi:hypothetical protein
MPSREDKKTGGPFDFQGTALPNSALFVTRQNNHYAELGIMAISTPELLTWQAGRLLHF